MVCDGHADHDPCAGGHCVRGVCIQVGCGNGVVDPGEACELGQTNAAGQMCRSDCTDFIRCGNGQLEEQEQCDCGDGTPGHTPSFCPMPNSDAPGSVCDTTCHLRCGDGVIESDEDCEPTDNPKPSCDADWGYYDPGTVGCVGCRYDFSQCTGKCGDGMVNGPEACDATDPGSQPAGSCIDQGYDEGRLTCSPICTVDIQDCRLTGWHDDPGVFAGINAQFSDVSSHWAVSNDGQAFHWDETTRTWVGKATPESDLASIWESKDGATVLALGDQDVIRLQPDGSWTKDFPVTFTAYSIRGDDPNDVWVSGGAGLVAHYDGSWSASNIGTTDDVVAIWPLSGTDVYAATRSGVYHFDGSSWTLTPMPLPVLGVWADAPDDVVITGQQGMAMRFDGTRWSAMRSLADGVLEVEGGTGPDDLYAVGRGTQYALGVPVYRWDGLAWTRMPDVVESSPPALHVDADEVIAAATTIHREHDAYWGPIATPPVNLAAVDARAPDDVIAVGAGGAVMQYDGMFWRSLELGTFDDLEDVWGDARSDRIIVGGSSILQWDGIAWSLTSSPAPGLTRVFGLGRNDAYATARRSVLRYDGVSWMIDYTDGSVAMTGVWASADDDVYVTSDGGALFHKGPLGWSSTLTSSPSLTAVDGTSAGDVVVGGMGYLAEWNGAAWTTLSTAHDYSEIRHAGPRDFYALTHDAAIEHWVSGTLASATAITPNTAAFALDPTATYWLVGNYLAISNATLMDQTLPPGGNVQAIWARSPDDVYFFSLTAHPIGYQASHFDGLVWSTDWFPSFGSGAWSDADQIFLGSVGAVLRFDGKNLTSDVAGGTINAIWGNDDKDVYAVSNLGVNHWDGSAWSLLPGVEGFTNLLGVWSSGPSDVYVVGATGPDMDLPYAEHWDGSAWSAIDTGLQHPIHAVFGTAPDMVLAGDDSGAAARWDGTRWTATATGVNGQFIAMNGSANDVFASTKSGLLRWDGRWAPIRLPASLEVRAIAPSGDRVWLGGVSTTDTLEALVRTTGWP
jgi:hypothetical protein